MADIKDRIAKLLALAENNPSESEARAALLRARELMAANKLRPEDCQKAETARVVKSLVGITVTAKKYAWGVSLAAIIAKHYCCVSYREHASGSQRNDIGFIGLEDDFEIATRIFRYAFDCVRQTSEGIFAKDADMYTAIYRRKNAEAYGYAFCLGLDEAFKEQQSEHQEWGLVMVVPTEVTAAANAEFGKKKPKSYGNMACIRDASCEARLRGYEDGRKFDPATRLAQAQTPLAIEG